METTRTTCGSCRLVQALAVLLQASQGGSGALRRCVRGSSAVAVASPPRAPMIVVVSSRLVPFGLTRRWTVVNK
ncbi:hypothetical protein PF011_g5632 [Phytophthora fragariae]|uniref:Secreted protein n=1 Tax=Phytophthora fragariae TaxID=53985 RepID=A0A6A3LNC6_9STRA|nr:hypothetical protein PF011_g5632 [Phytophthora fragariae]